jgi:hypothetical protein
VSLSLSLCFFFSASISLCVCLCTCIHASLYDCGPPSVHGCLSCFLCYYLILFHSVSLLSSVCAFLCLFL